MRHELSGSTVKISFDSCWEAEQFNSAIGFCQWIKFSKSTFAISDNKEESPGYNDIEKLLVGSCQPIFGKMPEMMPAKLEACNYASAIYVQHLSGYSGNYENKFKAMIDAGFELMRSPPSSEGKYWEIWYLYGEFAAKGPIKGMKLEEIVRWLYHNIGPGNVSLDYKRWVLSSPD